MEPLELDLTRCLTFVLMSVSVSTVYGATRVGLDSMSDVCFDVCFVSVSAVYGATRVGLDSMSDVCVDVCFSVHCVWSH